VRKQKTDREDARLLLKLLLENRFPRIWVPSPENRDLRQLLWHRHRLVQMRTRIMNQLQEVAMNEGYRWKKKLFSEQGRAHLEKLSLAPWASRRRQELLELLDRMNPTIEELTAAADREARKRPEVLRLMTHPGVGPLRSRKCRHDNKMNLQGEKTSRASQPDMGWRVLRTCSLLPVAWKVFLWTLPFIERGYRRSFPAKRRVPHSLRLL